MLSEKYIKWNPSGAGDIIHKAYFSRVKDDEDGVCVQIESEDGKTIINFKYKNFVISYLCTDEGDRLRSLDLLKEQYGNNILGSWPFFIVENSGYLNWFRAECYDTYQSFDIMHQVFITSNDIIDVLTTYEPDIEIIEK